MVVCIIGMHRSGTSAVARVLNLLGMDLGPETSMVRAAADNPKGFWELEPIVALNNEILARLGGKSFAPPEPDADWEWNEELDDLRDKATAIICENFSSDKAWAWKDPRTCITLPFWQRLIPGMRYVVVLRNPLEVAKSLTKRDGVLLPRALYLWLTYNRHALASTIAEQRHFIGYDRLMDHPTFEVAKLANFLGCANAGSDAASVAETFLDRELRHHKMIKGVEAMLSGRDAIASSALDIATRLYVALLSGQTATADQIDEQFDSALRLLPAWAKPPIEN